MMFADLIFPFFVIAFIATAMIGSYLRGGRKPVLERMVERGDLAALSTFRGTLVVAEHRPRFLLKLRKDSDASRLQFQYRWITGVGPQAIFDEVTFDGSKLSVELKRTGKLTTALFSQSLHSGHGRCLANTDRSGISNYCAFMALLCCF